MRFLSTSLFSLIGGAPALAETISIDTRLVGDAGNPADPLNSGPVPEEGLKRFALISVADRGPFGSICVTLWIQCRLESVEN